MGGLQRGMRRATAGCVYMLCIICLIPYVKVCILFLNILCYICYMYIYIYIEREREIYIYSMGMWRGVHLGRAGWVGGQQARSMFVVICVVN